MHRYTKGRTYSPPAKPAVQCGRSMIAPTKRIGKPSLTNHVPVQWTVAREGSTERHLNFRPNMDGNANRSRSPAPTNPIVNAIFTIGFIISIMSGIEPISMQQGVFCKELFCPISFIRKFYCNKSIVD